jgi:hypothetical protein
MTEEKTHYDDGSGWTHLGDGVLTRMKPYESPPLALGAPDFGAIMRAAMKTAGKQSKHEFPPDEFDAELDAIRALHAAKRSDYTAGQEDRLANYRFSAKMMGVPIDRAMFGRLSEKMYRLKSLYEKDGVTAVADESMDDTLRDIAIVAILMRLARAGGAYSER